MPTPSGENTNGTSGACMGCCLGEDANLAAAPLAQSLFFRPKVFRPRERRPPMGRRRHTMAVEALVPPDATRVATRCTAHSATVYTNGKKRHREAVFANLCTLLRPHDLLVRLPHYNSVHEWPKTAPRSRFRRSVYTVASPRHARTTLTLQQCTQMAKNGVERPFSPICVHSCVPTSVHNGATVYTNGPKQLQEATLADLCTLFASGGKPTLRDPRGRPPARPTRASKAEPPPYGRGLPNATDGLPMR